MAWATWAAASTLRSVWSAIIRPKRAMSTECSRSASFFTSGGYSPPSRAASAALARFWLPAAQPGRMGVEERQARRGGTRRSEGTRADEDGRHRPPAPAAAPTADRPGLLWRPRVGVHHRCRLKSRTLQSHWYLTVRSRSGRLASITPTPSYGEG